MKATGGQVLAAALASHDVDTVFLIPGIQLDWAVDALSRHSPQIRLFVPRHEQTTTYMADGYARVGPRPGVAMVVPGPGVLNAAAGMATAYAANSKVLLIAGQIHSAAIGAGLGLLHEIPDQSGIIASLTKWHCRIAATNEIPASIDRAFAAMGAGRPRPVAVEIPHDLLNATSEMQATNATSIAPVFEPKIDEAGIERIARIIDQARFPVIYAGGGVLAANAGDALRRFAEKIGAAVVMSDNGRGALSDRHDLGMNTLCGRALLECADVVVVVGSRFIDSMSPAMAWTSTRLQYIFVNIDAADFAAPRKPAVALHMDAKHALQRLCDAVRPRQVVSAAEALQVKEWADQQLGEVQPQIAYVRAMREALPDDAIFVNELTQVGYLARVAFPVYQPRTFITPGYQGTLGYGFPTALGAAVAGRGRRVLSITGDGGFGWNLPELATAKKYRLPVTLVVFNDGYFGNVRSIQQRVFGREVGVELQNPDFMALARAFGVPGVRVDSPAALGAEIRSSLGEPGPVLIEVAVGEMPSPWHVLRLTPMEGLKVPPSPPNPLRVKH